MSKAALEFLHEHGHQSLISLGCGEKLNRLDNHLKLLIGCGLNYYVGIDRVPQVSFDIGTAFIEKRPILEQCITSLGHFAQLVSFPVRKI